MGKNRRVKYNSSTGTYVGLNRRMFLTYMGGIVAIPFIPSLLPRCSWAQEDNFDYRRLVFMVNRHGGHWNDAEPININYQSVGNNVMAGELNQLGPIYQDLSGHFNSVKNNLSVLVGLDNLGCWGHPFSAAMTAGVPSVTRNSSGVWKQVETGTVFPDSIDTVLANSNKVYLNRPNLPVLRIGNRTHCFENGKQISGLTDPNAVSTLLLSQFVPSSETGGGRPEDSTEMSNLQKRRLASAETALLAVSAARTKKQISSQGKVRLEHYESLLENIRDGLKSTPSNPQTGATCQSDSFQNLSGSDEQKLAKLMVAALSCGITKLSYFEVKNEHGFVHQVQNPENRPLHREYLRTVALPVVGQTMHLMSEITEPNGRTLLDNSLVVHTSDLGSSTIDNHNGLQLRLLVGGSLGGKFRTGVAVDFQNRSSDKILQKTNASAYAKGYGIKNDIYGGRPYNEFLVTIAKAFGLSEQEYQRNNAKGFGTYNELQSEGHRSLYYDREAVGQTQKKVWAHYNNNFLPGYNRDSTLPYYYLG